MTANTDGGVRATAKRYENLWKDKSNAYWLVRLVTEVAELVLSLIGLHDDTPKHELIQIASICINWCSLLEGRDEKRF